MQGANLPRNDADDQPFIAYLDQDNSLARAERNASDNFHAALAKTFSAIGLSGQPRKSEKNADDQRQGESGLDERPGTDTVVGCLGSHDRQGEEQG